MITDEQAAAIDAEHQADVGAQTGVKETPEEVQEAVEAADGTEQVAEGAEEAEAVEAQPKKRSPQERIRELNAEKRAERARAEAAEQRAADYERRMAALEARLPAQQAQTAENQAPDPRNYEFGSLDQRFIADLTRHQVREQLRGELAAQETAKAQHAQQEAQIQATKALSDKAQAIISKGESAFDDYYDVVVEGANRGDYPMSESTFMTISEADNPEALSYWLASNPAEAKKIDRMSPAQASKFLFAKDQELAKRTAPRAAPPPQSGTRGSSGRFSVAPDTDDQKSFNKMFFSTPN